MGKLFRSELFLNLVGGIGGVILLLAFSYWITPGVVIVAQLLLSVVVATLELILIIRGSRRRLTKIVFTTVYVILTGIALIFFLILGQVVLGSLFAWLAVGSLFAGKAGIFIWTAALLPALKAIPAALSGYYVKKWLDERGKKKSNAPPSLPEPTLVTPPASPTLTKRARRRAAPPPSA